ncbi:gluconate 5-dehydrogenase [Clostridium tetanomorphum]|uniref:Glucose 1-dehydrogenase n=1 Tax=Clostridium tetanomorphum TaxID=1553 RepID=A0A923EEV5_CLOTT|nr:glucose 1-dehydrogenase [Clostridium tetanomorphum]KAJ50542.1 short-chain dehydrogenase/reductase SDR [Clostridium tetanomorphum DSM 665]MBC2399858.1 glucose 1-dehydrogenase [Clostridium tetanomorphum]MBP1866331.1 gluconate 5-dehydrogenase [Clostridium tetanomorphum]NRS83225.1 gluconate 5-dehydrogenase [Clostridium tetanomorphum]NRZ98675.1 gluconate 5-dehydrogenase [Clostridium tetanomorphum]
MSNLFDLTGKVAIITGASSGIGIQIAKAFAEQGANVALLARRIDRLENVAKEIEAIGRKALPVKCDVTKEDDAKSAVNTVITKFGKIDILMNNAGVASVGSVETIDTAEWDRVIDTNLKGTFLMSKYVVKHMKERGYGKIINTASICGFVGSKNVPLHAYNASKGAVVNLTRGMGTSLIKYGITVNAIGPSLFESEMTKNSLFQEDKLKLYNMVCPAGRPGNPGELNGAAIYFASDASSYTTGQILCVDGGWTAV